MKRLKPFLYVPIDNVVLRNVRSCGVRVRPRAINQIATEQEWRDLQKVLTDAAKMAGVPRVLFDDVWSEN